MTADLNHVTLSGRLARDPQLHTLPSGHVVCELEVACRYRARDPDRGAWREWSDLIDVRAFGFQARTANEHLRKGRHVALVGRVCSRKQSEPDGQERHVTEVIAQTVQFGERYG